MCKPKKYTACNIWTPEYYAGLDLSATVGSENLLNFWTHFHVLLNLRVQQTQTFPSGPCAWLIKHYAIKAYGRVDV
jgi:hypothetical protein